MSTRTNNWDVGSYMNKLDNSFAYFAHQKKDVKSAMGIIDHPKGQSN